MNLGQIWCSQHEKKTVKMFGVCTFVHTSISYYIFHMQCTCRTLTVTCSWLILWTISFLILFAVRPELTDTLAFKESRHPILDKVSFQPPIPNNIVRLFILMSCLHIVFWLWLKLFPYQESVGSGVSKGGISVFEHPLSIQFIQLIHF